MTNANTTITTVPGTSITSLTTIQSIDENISDINELSMYSNNRIIQCITLPDCNNIKKRISFPTGDKYKDNTLV